MVEFKKKCLTCKSEYNAKMVSQKYCHKCSTKKQRLNLLMLRDNFENKDFLRDF